jgi:copper chaperone CopZ
MPRVPVVADWSAAHLPTRKQAFMETKLRIDGANCSTCFNQTLDDLARLDGVRRVHGSLAGPCIEVDHDVPLETLAAVIANRLHGVEMFANEVRMIPVEPVVVSSCACSDPTPS